MCHGNVKNMSRGKEEGRNSDLRQSRLGEKYRVMLARWCALGVPVELRGCRRVFLLTRRSILGWRLGRFVRMGFTSW